MSGIEYRGNTTFNLKNLYIVHKCDKVRLNKLLGPHINETITIPRNFYIGKLKTNHIVLKISFRRR